jgi:hypothetical protein
MNSQIKKTAPFRANPAVLKFKDALADLQAAWDHSKARDKDPHHRFHHASKRLNAKYMAVQRAPKEQQGELALLKAKLTALKQEIVDIHLEEQVEELVATKAQVRKLKEINISLHKRLSRIHWLGEGNEPSKIYFATLKAKIQREAMPLLLWEDSSSITGDVPILLEVTRNYTKQFAEQPLTQTGSQLQR